MAATAQSAIAVIGIDIGKNSFHVVGLDGRGAIVLRQKWSRGQVEARFANMSPCLIGMEACVGAHHLSRKLKALGHDARLMPARYVRPYSKGQKNDFRDAEAIAEAVQRPTMKFVVTKTADQLDLQALHRVRERLVSQRTGIINQIRAFLLERGMSPSWLALPANRRTCMLIDSGYNLLSCGVKAMRARILYLAVLLAFAVGPADAQPITLKFSHFLGPTSFFQLDVVEPWAKELEAKTNGKVKVEIHDGTSPLGKVTEQASAAQAGTVDIALGLRGAEGDRFPGSSIIELPLLVTMPIG